MGGLRLKNTGKLYETLTEQVFSRLLAQSGLCTKVERDVEIAGKSTSHQIDVTFEFVVGPLTYRTIVQCKDWGAPVKKEQVLTFHSVLNDIAGQPRGIIVSRSGFQKGAREYAKCHGISLYELREPRDEDWDGLIRTVVISLTVQSPRFDNVRLIPDIDWARTEAQRLSLPLPIPINVRFDPNQCSLTFESGDPCNLTAILASNLPPPGGAPILVRHEFGERAFLEIPKGVLPRVATVGVEAMVSVHEVQQETQASIDHLVAYTFRDVLRGTTEFLGKDGGPVQQE